MAEILDDYLLLGDASALLRFFAAGPTCSKKLAERLADRLFVVHDVEVELERWRGDARYRAGADAFFEAWQGGVLPLPPEVTLEVNDELKFHIKYGFTRDDRGETATVLFARHAQQANDTKWVILMGDKGGHDFAQQREVDSVETRDLLLLLVDDGTLSRDEGELVWLEIHSNWAARDRDGCIAAFDGEL